MKDGEMLKHKIKSYSIKFRIMAYKIMDWF
jgi:hypothetical protein